MNSGISRRIKALYGRRLEEASDAGHLGSRFDARMKLRIVLTSILVAVVVIGHYFTGLIREQQYVFMHASRVEVEYQRRQNLVPRLEAIAKKYAEHERQLMRYVADARSLKQTYEKLGRFMDPAQKAQAQRAVIKLMALAEQYPDLKADKSYEALMAKIVATENRVASERAAYVSRLNDYNRQIQTFPGVLFARLYGFRPMEVYIPERDPMPLKDRRFFFIY